MTQSNPPTPSAASTTPGNVRPHAPAGDHEEVYFDGPPSAWSALGSVVLFAIVGLVIAACPFVALRMNAEVPWWLYPLAVLVGLLVLMTPFFRAKALRYRISNYRIDFERGMLWKKIDTLELWHVEDLSFTQTPLDRVLGLGTIAVVAHDPTTPRLVLYGLPHARPIFDSLKQRVIAVKRQQGVIKMDIG